MTDELALYAFVPWLRRGIGASLLAQEGDGGPVGPRLVMDVKLTFNAGETSTRIDLLGPGDVIGLDPRVVSRTWPRADVHDAESNYFPLIEFSRVDLPWCYTPARVNDDRLNPWLTLIVLRDDEIASYSPATPGQPLAVVEVRRPVNPRDADALPDPAQAWAWAHVHVNGVHAERLDEAKMADLLAHNPEQLAARLLCPRRLDPSTPYRAFVVPGFERGRLAGVGEPVADNVDALTPAWQQDRASVRLPVYYEWRFQTGVAGDFESLVRLLQPRPLPEEVGIRPMDVSRPRASLPGAARQPLGIEGALKTSRTKSTDWPEDERTPFIAGLRELLNRPAQLLASRLPSVVVTPPLYGRWHAARQTIEAARPQPWPWFDELNSDPRLRVTAGLGTQVIRSQQRQLMASAWQQVEGVREANQELRQAQLAREAAVRMYERHITVADSEAVLALTAPLHSRLLSGAETVRAQLRSSPLASGVLETQLARVARQRGPIGRRLAGRTSPAGMLTRLNDGEITVAPPPPTSKHMTTPASTGSDFSLLPQPATLASTLRAVRGRLPAPIGRPSREAELLDALRSGTLTAEQVARAPLQAGFAPVRRLPGEFKELPPPAAPSGQSEEVAPAFRAAAVAVLERSGAPVAQAPPVVSQDLRTLSETIVASLDPRAAIEASVSSRLNTPADWKPKDPLEPVLAAPEFRQPMYEPLRDLSQDWLLPNLGLVPPNTLSLLITNQRFVEAYMVGLNHEFGNELLWNEYPTDHRGSYFRQFWDVGGTIAAPRQTIEPETLKDIKPIHVWKDAQLGSNAARSPPPGGEYLVLLVRGDVLRRYPNALVYAVKAERTSAGERKLGSEEQHPVFRGTLEPDISFFGFKFTPEQARGSTSPDSDPGWFFVLQEHPSEPRFGLNLGDPDLDPGDRGPPPPQAWNHLSWGHLAGTNLDPANLTYIDLNAQRPDTTQIRDRGNAAWHADRGRGPTGARASDLAYITLQFPFRVAVHGAQMLPPPADEGQPTTGSTPRGPLGRLRQIPLLLKRLPAGLAGRASPAAVTQPPARNG